MMMMGQEKKMNALNTNCGSCWEIKGRQSPDSPEKHSELERWSEWENHEVEIGNSVITSETLGAISLADSWFKICRQSMMKLNRRHNVVDADSLRLVVSNIS